MLIKTLNIKVSFRRAFEDSQRWAAVDRVRQTVPGARCCDGEGAVLRPLFFVVGLRRVAVTMRSADDAERRQRRDSALATGQMAFCR